VQLVELLTWGCWLVAGSVLLTAAAIALEGARWWLIGILVFGVIATLDVFYLRRRLAKRIANPPS
jgi:hypothetical protein